MGSVPDSSMTLAGGPLRSQMWVMSWRAYLEAATVAGRSLAQNNPVAFRASAPIADAKEADDVLVNPVKECDGNRDDDDNSEGGRSMS